MMQPEESYHIRGSDFQDLAVLLIDYLCITLKIPILVEVSNVQNAIRIINFEVIVSLRLSY